MKYTLRDIVGTILILLGSTIQVWNAFVYPLSNQMVFGFSMFMIAVASFFPYLDSQRKIQSKIEYARILVMILLLITSIRNIII